MVGIPAKLKAIAAGDKKVLLKRLASRLIPWEFDMLRKQGFVVPLYKWLMEKGPFRDCFLGSINSIKLLF